MFHCESVRVVVLGIPYRIWLCDRRCVHVVCDDSLAGVDHAYVALWFNCRTECFYDMCSCTLGKVGVVQTTAQTSIFPCVFIIHDNGISYVVAWDQVCSVFGFCLGLRCADGLWVEVHTHVNTCIQCIFDIILVCRIDEIFSWTVVASTHTYECVGYSCGFNLFPVDVVAVPLGYVYALDDFVAIEHGRVGISGTQRRYIAGGVVIGLTLELFDGFGIVIIQLVYVIDLCTVQLCVVEVSIVHYLLYILPRWCNAYVGHVCGIGCFGHVAGKCEYTYTQSSAQNYPGKFSDNHEFLPFCKKFWAQFT